ncbi:MAG: transcriptional repressor LexA [Planctomycetota bacterium]
MASVPLTRRQREILDFFQAYTAETGISPTYEEVARHFGINKVTIFGHVRELERKGVLKRAKKGISRGLQLVQETSSQKTAGATPSLNVLGTIAAGAPIETLEEPETLDLAELAPPGKDVYVLRVEGDSMIEDAIRDGDLVVVEKRSDALQGQIVVAVLPDEEATLKRYYKEPDGRVRLQPANAAMQPIFVDDVEIRGVVLGVIRRY